MADLANFPQRVRFGAFEVDLRAGELWKAGRKRKLTGQPFSVLAILLERPGEVVSREELQRRLWPDTFVDVDHNLNTAINKIREALDDSPEQSRFVETLSRRGYRFIAPVESVQAAPPRSSAKLPSTLASENENSSTVASATEISSVPASAPIALKSRKRAKPWLWPAAAAAFILVLAYFLRPALPPPQVTGITQLTRDAATKLQQGTPANAMLTDGSSIYFVENPSEEHDGQKLVQVSTEGGDPVPVELPSRFDGIYNISPVRPELLIGGPPFITNPVGEGLWILPIPGGQARRIGNLRANDATWSPDASAIYYSSGQDLFKANPDGSQSRKFLSTSGIPFWLRFSPDGHLLRFSVYNLQLSTTSLWEAHSDGSHLRQLFGGWNRSVDQCCASWMRDGKYFIFQASRDGMENLWAVREKPALLQRINHEPVQLTAGGMSAHVALPANDGTKVFFVGSSRRAELVKLEPATRSFTRYLNGPSAQGMTFTADGKRVAYVSFPEGVLWQSRTDGGDRHQLTFPPTEAGLPRWSPDGAQIAFSAHEPGGTWQIFVIPAEGGEPEQLTSGDSDSLDPSWSPDGSSLAFGGDVFQDIRFSKENTIDILNLKTRKITAVPNSSGLFAPRWSPDGRYLLAVPTADSGKLELYDFTTARWEDLANIPAGWPSWSHDGKCVYFSNPSGTNLPVYRICLKDRKVEHIADLSTAGALAWGPFSWWTGLGPDDSILTARDTSVEEIYALDVKFP